MLLQPCFFHKHPTPTAPPSRLGVGAACTPLPVSVSLFALMSLLVFMLLASSVEARSTAWRQGDLAAAKRHAAGRPLLVQVSAAWCSPCNQLHHEVHDTPAILPFLQRAVGVRIDFDTPQGQAITRRYAILDLPTLLLLDATGQEIGRLQGYNGKEAYLRHLHALFQQHNEVLSLQTLRAQRPLTPHEQLHLARALLVRGKHPQAYALLQPLLFQPSSVGQDATRIWGRWLLRVQKRPLEADAHFQRAARTYANTPAFGGFLYWQANSLHQQNQTSQAIALFTQWAQRSPHDSLPPMLLADFLLHHRLSPDRSYAAIQQAFRRLPTHSPLYKKRAPWLFYLSAQYHQRQGHLIQAHTALQQALQLSPHTALYQNFARQIPPLPPSSRHTRSQKPRP